ncbi:MAG: hypothetical protein ACKJSK_20155 [Roseibacillus sp.]|jgi:hypothetical protein
MLFLSFLYALALLGLGITGVLSSSNAEELRAFALPGLFFGGSTLFCSIFAIKEPRHGMAAASFLVFLAFLTNTSPLAGHLVRGTYDWSHPAHRISSMTWAVSLIYLSIAFAKWKRGRRARAIAELEADLNSEPD